MSSYQPGIPTGLVNLDVDYQNLQNNFGQLDTSFGVDHTLFSVNTATAPAGYHKSVHLIPQSNVAGFPPDNDPPVQPATTAGFSQLWSAQINDGLNPDEALFFLTGGGRSIQMTRNTLPVAASTGLSFIPGPSTGGAGAFGAILVQWGTISAPGGTSTDFNFPVAFPNNCFFVQLTGIRTGTTPFIINIKDTPTTTSFKTLSSSSTAHDVYYLAFGN